MAQRRSGGRGFDRGGGRRSIFRSRYAKMFYVVGVVGLLGGLLPVFLLGGGSTTTPDGEAPLRRLESEVLGETGAVEGKPTFDAPPLLTLDVGQEYVAVVELENGVVRIELFDDEAPIHVNNFIFLVDQGFYDNLTFHRVVADFVAQTGAPDATLTGSAGYFLPDDDVGENAAALTLDGVGILAMMRSPQEGAFSSQFFITLTPQPQLDSGGFTAFGRVVEGMEFVLALPERNPQLVPVPAAGGRIRRISIEVLEPDGAAAAEEPASAPEIEEAEQTAPATADGE